MKSANEPCRYLGVLLGFLGRRNNMGKDPVVGVCLTCSKIEGTSGKIEKIQRGNNGGSMDKSCWTL